MIKKLYFKIQSVHEEKEKACKPDVDELVVFFLLCNTFLKSSKTTLDFTGNNGHKRT